MLLDILTSLALETILGLPALPKNSTDWKKRRKRFAMWFGVVICIIVAIIALAMLNTYGIL